MLKNLKLKAVVGCLAVALIATPDATAAFSLSGKACKKTGKIAVSEGATYICKKNKKKLLWQVKEAQPPKPLLLPTSFDDLLERSTEAHIGAWNLFNTKNLIAKPVEVKQEIYVGPNSTLNNPKISDAFIQGTKLFEGFRQPDSFIAIYYNFSDKDWAKAKLQENGLSSRASEVDYSCPNLNHCNGASAGKGNGNTGFSQFGLPKANEQDAYHLNGAIEIHEYAHMVQAMQFVGKASEDKNMGYLPSWFLEGHAHAVSNLGVSKSLSDYQIIRKEWFKTSPNQEIKSFQPQDIERFYDELMPFKGNPEMFGYVYTLGYITIETLMALKGFDSPSILILEVSNGASFEDAFLKVYGITWASAKPILAQVVSKQFLGK